MPVWHLEVLSGVTMQKNRMDDNEPILSVLSGNRLYGLESNNL